MIQRSATGLRFGDGLLGAVLERRHAEATQRLQEISPADASDLGEPSLGQPLLVQRRRVIASSSIRFSA